METAHSEPHSSLLTKKNRSIWVRFSARTNPKMGNPRFVNSRCILILLRWYIFICQKNKRHKPATVEPSDAVNDEDASSHRKVEDGCFFLGAVEFSQPQKKI